MHFGHARFVYNYFLDHSQKQYEIGNKTNYRDWAGILTRLKKTDDRSWLKGVNSQTLQQSLKDLQTAYVNFFKKRAGFPKFKKKSGKNSFRVPQFVQVYEDENLVFFPRFKERIKVRIHRRLPQGCKIKQATFSGTPTGKFFVAVLVETDEQPVTRIINPQNSIGIDVGLKDFAVLSDGTKVPHPKVLSKYEHKLARCQRRLSKKKKGSNNRNRARVKVALIHLSACAPCTIRQKEITKTYP